MDPDQELQHDFLLPILSVYKSGRVERFRGTDFVPASIDADTGVASKDVVIDPITGVSARLYLPKISQNTPAGNRKKLPVLVYYHGGGFCIESAFSPTYHSYLNPLACKAGIIIVSVEYRLAPEHLLPAAYDDSWAALNWVASHAGGGGDGCGDAWLSEHGDFEHVFLAGDSAGANIVHHMALRAGEQALQYGVEIEGVVLTHPYFWGTEAVAEETEEAAGKRRFIEGFWKMACPPESGGSVDDPMFNPMVEGAPSLGRLGCRRVMVCVAEKDALCKRGQMYYEKLKESGFKGELEMLESEGEDHVFHLFKPAECEKAMEMMDRLLSFFNQ